MQCIIHLLPYAGHFKSDPIQYRAAVTELLARAVSVFNHKIQKLGDRMEGIHDDVSDLICDLQNAAVDSNESLRRVALGPNDHFFLPSSAEYRNSRDYGCQQEQKENLPHRPNLSINAHSVLGQILFDACVPKNVEGWDIKFSSSSKGHPFTSRSKHSPQNAKKCLFRSRL